MIRNQLTRALETLGDRLPAGELVVLLRRAFGDRSVSLVRGDVVGVTGHPASSFERPTERWLEIVHPEDRDTVLEALGELPASESVKLEYRLQDPDGGARWIREQLQVHRPGPDSPPEVVGILRNVTFERTIQAKVSGLEREAWKSRKLKAVGTMAGSIAHDFNNVLTVILSAADLLRSDPGLAGDSLEDLLVLREAAERGSDLVRQILRFMSERPIDVDPLDPAELIRDLTPLLRKAVGRRVDLTVELEDDVWPVRADRSHLEQILLNLTYNAKEAMPGGGALLLELENRELEESLEVRSGTLDAGSWVVLRVRDTGTGMSDEVRERLFEPFFSTKYREGDRTGGLGLPNVLRIVRGYGGGIGVASRSGRGSEFEIHLPAWKAGAGELPADWSVGEIPDPDPGRLRILLVDGDRSVREAVGRILERDGHSVVGAGTVGRGLQAFDRVRPPFDLLVSAVVLPDRRGHDLWRAARRRVPELPALFLTDYDREETAREGVGESEAFLSKPVDPQRLRDAIEWLSPREDDGPSRKDATL